MIVDLPEIRKGKICKVLNSESISGWNVGRDVREIQFVRLDS